MAQVRAVAQGFDGVCLRNPGEEFSFDGAPASWFEYLDPKEKAAAETKAAKDREAKRKAFLAEKHGAEIDEEAQKAVDERLLAELKADAKAKALKAAGQEPDAKPAEQLV